MDCFKAHHPITLVYTQHIHSHTMFNQRNNNDHFHTYYNTHTYHIHTRTISSFCSSLPTPYFLAISFLFLLSLFLFYPSLCSQVVPSCAAGYSIFLSYSLVHFFLHSVFFFVLKRSGIYPTKNIYTDNVIWSTRVMHVNINVHYTIPPCLVLQVMTSLNRVDE